jgi:hypothetical protein
MADVVVLRSSFVEMPTSQKMRLLAHRLGLQGKNQEASELCGLAEEVRRTERTVDEILAEGALELGLPA